MTGSRRIERLRRTADALLELPTPEMGEVDSVLTRCAAEALLLRAQLVRLRTELHEALAADHDSGALEGAPRLARRTTAIATDLQLLDEAMIGLRARRDQLSAH